MENCAHSEYPKTVDNGGVQNHAREEIPPIIPGGEWRLEPHICRSCFGRLVSRHLAGDLHEYRCTNCEATSQHTDATMACCCGIKVRKRNGAGRSGGPMVDAGIRCIPNPEKSPSFPAAYVASEVVKLKRP